MPVDCPGQMSRLTPNRCWRMPKETNWESRCSMHQDGHTYCVLLGTNSSVCCTWLAAKLPSIHSQTSLKLMNVKPCDSWMHRMSFNSINHQVALQNIKWIFPLLAPMIINTYRIPSCLFTDGESIMSTEGVTQATPWQWRSMPSPPSPCLRS